MVRVFLAVDGGGKEVQDGLLVVVVQLGQEGGAVGVAVHVDPVGDLALWGGVLRRVVRQLEEFFTGKLLNSSCAVGVSKLKS